MHTVKSGTHLLFFGELYAVSVLINGFGEGAIRRGEEVPSNRFIADAGLVVSPICKRRVLHHRSFLELLRVDAFVRRCKGVGHGDGGAVGGEATPRVGFGLGTGYGFPGFSFGVPDAGMVGGER